MPPGGVLAAIDQAVAEAGVRIDSRALFKELVNGAFRKIRNPKPLRIREFPQAFHDYRRDEMKRSGKPRPVARKKSESAKRVSA